jgi:hypothetical protein
VAIDIRLEPPIKFNDAAKLLAESGHPSMTTWWRWWKKGIRGILLETIVIGGRRYTTAAALQRFVEALSERSTDHRDGARSPRMRQLEQVRAEQELNEADI